MLLLESVVRIRDDERKNVQFRMEINFLLSQPSIMIFLSKKFDKLKLDSLKVKCSVKMSCLLESQRCSERTKGDAAIKICQTLLKVCEEINDASLIREGFMLLQFIKALTMQVHEVHRIEVYFVKIRTYLLTIRWSRTQELPLTKVIPRATLFLEEMKTTPLYESIASDFYSHIERLYLEIIHEKIKNNALNEALRLIGVCFESFKVQIANICSIFDVEEKKLHKLVEKKLQLLEIIFKYEHGVRYVSSIMEPEQITSQMLPKYERITFKIPIIHFPNESLISDCEAIWMNTGNKSIKQNSLSKKGQSIIGDHTSNYQFDSDCKERNRSSLKETAQFVDEFFRKRSTSAVELGFDRSPMNLHFNKKQSVTKKSYFQKEKMDNLNDNNFPIQGRISSVQKLKEIKRISKKKRAKSGIDLIQPKKFKLVIEMDREARQKAIRVNPFSVMKHDQINILSCSKQKAGSLIVV